MTANEQPLATHFKRRHGRISACLASVRCFLRGLPLFFSAAPKTPLRVLCIMAFDSVHVLRSSKPLPRHRLRVLAALLDFGACANAALDHKAFCTTDCQRARLHLQEAGLDPMVDDYVRQLRELEQRRPAPGGGPRQFEEVRSYREAVARLSLGIVAETAFGDEGVETGIVATHRDEALEILFRIVMQCQIIDDILDYAKDASAGLPSFLTAAASLPQAIELTAQTAGDYATRSDLAKSGELFPLRIALFAVSALTKVVIRLRFWQHRIRWAAGWSGLDHQREAPVEYCQR
jgi:hypothetical protein